MEIGIRPRPTAGPGVKRGFGLAIALGALLVAAVPGTQPAAAHVVPADTELEFTIEQIYVGLPGGNRGRFRVNFQAGWSESSCASDPRVDRNVVREVIRFDGRGDRWYAIDRRLTLGVNSAHVLCVYSWGEERDPLTRDDVLPLRTHRFTAADTWGEGHQRLDAVPVRGLQRVNYILDYRIRRLSIPSGGLPAIRAGSIAWPDLRVSEIRVSQRPDRQRGCRGNQVNFVNVEVHNHGDAAAAPTWLRVEGDGEVEEALIPRLEAGSSYTTQVTLELAEGERTVRAVADARGTLRESDETNNESSVAVRC